MGEVKVGSSKQTSKPRLIHGNLIPNKSSLLNDQTSNQPNATLQHGDRNNNDSQWNEVRIGVWFLASELSIIEDLQIFADMVEPTDPIDIKRTAQILAKAQLELRALLNDRKATNNGNL